MVFEKSHFFVLGPPWDRFGSVFGLILEALGPILGGSWAILAAQDSQKSPKTAPRVAMFQNHKFSSGFLWFSLVCILTQRHHDSTKRGDPI